ncbi:MAG: tape measure protein, partial [Gammaproteobacteria bacterium]
MSGLTELAMRLLIGAEDRTGPAAKSARQNVQSISDQLARFEVVAKRVLDLRLFVGFAKDSIELSDGYKALSGRITQVTKDTGNLAAKQAQLFDLAQDTQTGLGSTVNLFTKSAEALKNVQDGQEKALKLTEAVNLSFKAQALGTADIESTVRQLTQAIGTSNVQWEDFGQVADANLLLANVAAKNLGFDGLGALKQAMSNNQVTNTQLVDSIIGGLDEIKAASEAMPLTVQAAFTTLNNSVLRYVGESDAANKSTQAIAGSIRLLADNLNTVANAAVLVAEIYGTRVAIGLLKSAQGYVENAQAARASAAAAQQEAAAQQAQLALKEKLATVQLKIAEASLSNARASKAEAEAIQSKNTASKAELETEVQQIALKASLAKSRLASAAAAVEEAQLQRALAVSNEQQVAANRALALSVEHLRQSRSALSRANSEAVIYNGELAAANDRLTISEKRLAEANGTLSAEVKKYNTSAAASKAASAALGGGFGATAGEANKFDKAMTAVNWSINAWLAWDIGTTVGEWLRQFESVRIAGTYLAETFAIIASGIEGMFSGISIGERWAQIQKIHAEFSQIRQNETDQAITSQQNIEASEKAKAKAAEESAERQRIAYEKIKEATKQLTAIIDADAKQQAVSIKQQLAEREAAINAMDISDAERDRLRFVAQQLAADQEILLQRRVTEDKLALIDKQYNDEIQKAEANKTRVQQLEQEKRQAKLSVYQGLAEFYQGEVDRLQGVYANEEQLALQSRQQLQALAISHEAALFQIGLKGLDDREKISKEESRFNELIRRAREEQAKGEQADQDKINQLLTEARNLHQD